MFVKRSAKNPIISPNREHPWEAYAAFNWSIVKDEKHINHCVYRAVSDKAYIDGHDLHVSTIGYVRSDDGIVFENRRQLVAPKEPWERFGCEDPRVVAFEGKFYIFYTALSNYPFDKDCIKVAVAITSDFETIEERHLVTPFNAKAMTLFPERINGKIVAVLAVNTDNPPSHIAFAEFDTIEQMWSEEYWTNWYAELPRHTIHLRRKDDDQVEVGAIPIKTKAGWLFLYSHIQNYYSDKKIFGIECLLLDLNNPRHILSRTDGPLFIPEESYEHFGLYPNIIFPSGGLIYKHKLYIYYGATDTTCCRASINVNDLLTNLKHKSLIKRYDDNPILVPNLYHPWEEEVVFNPAAIDIDGKVHILYRAAGKDNVSVIGYASSKDGCSIDERCQEPVYVPRESFEKRAKPDAWGCGCEDPRVTQIGDRVYMLYTAYDGVRPPSVAATSISVDDLLAKRWENWAKPHIITPIGVDDKDACLFPEKVNGQYLVFHRVAGNICLDPIASLDFEKDKVTTFTPIMSARPGMWDSQKVGISGPPIKTEKGWLLFYHGVSAQTHYCVGTVLLDLKDPRNILARSIEPIFTPEESYEKIGWIPNVVFPCGNVLRDNTIFLYYGGADKVVGVATCQLDKVLDALT